MVGPCDGDFGAQVGLLRDKTIFSIDELAIHIDEIDDQEAVIVNPAKLKNFEALSKRYVICYFFKKRFLKRRSEKIKVKEKEKEKRNKSIMIEKRLQALDPPRNHLHPIWGNRKISPHQPVNPIGYHP